MTILSIIGGASLVIGHDVPAAVYSSDERDHQEMGGIANAMAAQIARDHEWQKLKRLATFTGDGTTTEFALPADFDRFPRDQKLRTTRRWGWLEHVRDHDIWLDRLMRPFSPTLGSWTILGGAIHFNPALLADEQVKAYYFTHNWAMSRLLEPQAAFVADDDTFVLDPEVLRLGIIWRWKKDKELPSDAALMDFDDAKSIAASRDKGPGAIAIGEARAPRGMQTAYPYTLG